MAKKATKKSDINDKLKYEIAEELGLTEKVEKYGWKALTAKETGRIGGILANRKHQKNTKEK